MAEERQPAQIETRRKAQELAKAAGKKWPLLSTDERRAFLTAARSGRPVSATPQNAASSQHAPNPWREVAMKAAADEGKTWRDIPKEERQKYLQKARDDWSRKYAQERRQGR